MWRKASISWGRTYDAMTAARSHQAVVSEREDILVQDPGNHRQLGQPDGRRNDPAFESANQGLDHVHRYAASQRTFTYVDHRIFQMVWRWCRRRHRKKSRKWIKEKYFQRDGHRHWVFTGTLRDHKGQGWPIQLMAAAKVKIIRYVKIRSAVNPYDPKWELYLEARLGWQLAQTLDRSQTDRISMEGTKGTMSGLWSTAANRRGRLPDPPSDLAQPRRSGHGRQHGVVPCQLSSADPRARTTDKSGRVPRGAFVKA